MQENNNLPKWLLKEREEAKAEGEGQEITREQYQKINEGLIQRNPTLGNLDERVVYDKEFLLEVQAHGYNPLDKEDVQNFLDKKPPKDLERNLILCGAGKYNELGQSNFGEDDLKDFLSKKKVNIAIKKAEDVYLSDIPAKKQKDYLIEEEQKQENDYDEKLLNELSGSEDTFRKNLAKVFGSDEMKINKKDYNKISASTEMIKSDDRAQKILELIKELRALGFSPEEIKKEIQRFH